MWKIILGSTLLVLGAVAYLFRLEFICLGGGSKCNAMTAAMAVAMDNDYALTYKIITYGGIGLALVGLILLIIGIAQKASSRPAAVAAVPPAAPNS